MENPFTSGQIKNYLLLYASVVVIMILFFIASSLFNEIEDVDMKVFNTQKENKEMISTEDKVVKDPTPKFKLLDKAY